MFGRRDKGDGEESRSAGLMARLNRRESLNEAAAAIPAAVSEAPPSASVTPMPSRKAMIEETCRALALQVAGQLDVETRLQLSRGELARMIGEIVSNHIIEQRLPFNLLEQRDMVTVLLNELLAGSQPAGDEAAPAAPEAPRARVNQSSVLAAKIQLQPQIMQRIDVATTATLPRAELESRIGEVVAELTVKSSRTPRQAVRPTS